MAIVVTAKVLGPELGIAGAVGAIVFAVVIGAIMHLIYRKEELDRANSSRRGFEGDEAEQPLHVVVTFFALMIGMLVFANWAAADNQTWMRIYELEKMDNHVGAGSGVWRTTDLSLAVARAAAVNTGRPGSGRGIDCTRHT